ncbi:endogenous retrovirus group K member 19 Gag polyprotein-like [Dermochelys coriacea]|uniref:endogenous retrovirus group K member 19 Gag polyprotein-like n=1 Tax=Dermochelys coriacea TaxID=27794 RepID=UPI0018E7CDD9|nr:endogenous retrovirus group K member 19 Gag polyprotein-like [Dermochelys coriacea]
MGTAASADEQAVFKVLSNLLNNQGEKFSPEALQKLLRWGKRRGVLVNAKNVFDSSVWKTVGEDLWDFVGVGNKEAAALSPIWRTVHRAVTTAAAQAGARIALREALESSAKGAFTVGAKDFFGKTTPMIPLARLDPSEVPLPLKDDDSDRGEPMAVDQPVSGELSSGNPENPLQGGSGLPPAVVPSAPPRHVRIIDLPKTGEFDNLTQDQIIRWLYKEGIAAEQMMDELDRKENRPQGSSRSHLLQQLQEHGIPDPSRLPHICRLCGYYGCTEHLTPEGELRPTAEEEYRKIYAPATQPVQPKVKPLPPTCSSIGRGQEERGTGVIWRDGGGGAGSPDPIKRWHGLIKDAIIEGEFLDAMPATFPVSVSREGVKSWVPLDWKLMREAQKAIVAYGLKNPYVQALLEQIFSGQAMCPFDAQKFADMLLTPTQRLLWKDSWRKKAEHAAVLNLDRPQDDPLHVASIDMLLGQGRFEEPQLQARLVPQILQQSQLLALKAFKELPDLGTPSPPYLKVTQGVGESFALFLDRLRTALDRAPNLTPDARSALGVDLALQNANPTCKKILVTLLKSASLVDMIEACTRAPLVEEEDKAKIHAHALALALNTSKLNWRRGREGACY